MKKLFVILSLVAFLLPSCVNTGNILPSVTGSSYEILVVMDHKLWNNASGDSVRKYIAADMQQMPQVEPLFTISQTNYNGFSNILKPVRNILILDVDSTKYTQAKVTYLKNQWAKPQVVVRVTAPNVASFNETMGLYGQNMANYFVKNEIERQVGFYKGYTNFDAQRQVLAKYGVQMNIPNDIAYVIEKKDFTWITDDRTPVQRSIIIYSYPYTEKETFTKEYLLMKRDSVLQRNMPGEFEDSYMSTEYEYIPPVFNNIAVNNNYCAEIRGLWKMKNGNAMGGPFVSHTRLDELSQRVITMEVFVYAPGQKKRNPLRQMEAVLYSAKLPQEINALPEIEVRTEKQEN